jgi:hypothetical protein
LSLASKIDTTIISTLGDHKRGYSSDFLQLRLTSLGTGTTRTVPFLTEEESDMFETVCTEERALAATFLLDNDPRLFISEN